MRVRLFMAFALFVPLCGFANTSEELLGDGHVRVRVRTEPAEQVVIGEQTRLFVEIMTDTWFSKAPVYPELVIDGAIALLPEPFGSNFTERIDGVTFAAQRRSYLIFPERAGILEIPGLEIRLGVAEEGKAGTTFTVRTRPQRLNVIVPSEALGIDGLITTPRLEVYERWSRGTRDLKVGDAIERTVRMNADRALGMLLPEVTFTAPPGIAVYADRPRISDSINRGRYRGERVETVTYVLQRPGDFILPAIELPWWDPVQGSLEVAVLAERTLEVREIDEGVARGEPDFSWRDVVAGLWENTRKHGLSLALAAFAAMLMVRLWRWLWPEFLVSRRARREKRLASESHLFRVLEKSVRHHDVDAIVYDFWRWRDRWFADAPSLGRGGFRQASESSGFAKPWAELERQRYRESSPSIDLAELRATLRDLREALRKGTEAQPAPAGSPLRLNPIE